MLDLSINPKSKFYLGNNKSDEGGKVCYETREGARLHFISFETRQIEKVQIQFKINKTNESYYR